MDSRKKYRKDIDGLRAIAVLSVIVFHLGYLPKGYLGVDVFFVISGFLITGIIYKEILENRFSIYNFYLRRTRRIIPLVSFMCVFSLIIGYFFMLPDDLENLAQSVLATNFFSNNILAVITTKNYWDVLNEFKPLMHTWSLGIEEQYYLFYPFIFLFLGRKRIKLVLPVLVILTLISLALVFSSFESFYKFYLLPFRFYELSIGGIVAIFLNGKLIDLKFSPLLLLLLLCLLFLEFTFISTNVLIILTVIITSLLLMSANEKNKLTTFFLENKIIVFIGKLSFSLYMWHQILIAFSRYFVFEEFNLLNIFFILILTFLLSLITYYFIEEPFRNSSKVKNKKLFLILGSTFFLTSAFSFYLYLNAGVVRDVNELNISRGTIEKNMHAKYNDRIYLMNKNFESENKIKILVIGNSLARDWANVLLESNFKKDIEISYMFNPKTNDPVLEDRVSKATYIFYSPFSKDDLDLPVEKVWCVGVKNFGINNGIFYNSVRDDNYCFQRTKIKHEIFETNKKLREKWNERYIDIIELLIDDNNKMPVFTADCKFISQDTEHLTEFGAKHISNLFEKQEKFILNRYQNNYK